MQSINLKDYQVAGINFAVNTKRCIIILPPGAGKTLIALETIRRLKISAAIFCPKSLVGQWERQIGDLPITVIPISQIKNVASLDVDMIVVDEAKPVKSYTLIFKELMRFKAKRKMILDATPVENYLEEIWFLFRWLKPSILGTLDAFREKYTGFSRFTNLCDLRARIKPHIFAPAVADVREKVYTVHKIPFNEADKEYNALCKKLSYTLGQLRTAKDFRKLNNVRGLISKVRSWLSDPERGAKSKIKHLVKLLYYSATRFRGIIFCYRKDTVKKLVEVLNAKGIRSEAFTGELSAKKREALRNGFNDGTIRFLVATSAGERGIDLPSGNLVVHFDLPWTFSAFAQRDRISRVSSDLTDKSIIVTLIAENSVEEVMWSIICAKRDLMMVPFMGKANDVYMHKTSWREFIQRWLKNG